MQATEKQLAYLSGLVQSEIVNRNAKIDRLTSEKSDKLTTDVVRRIREAIVNGMTAEKASQLIEAVKQDWAYGPKSTLNALGYTQADLKALLS